LGLIPKSAEKNYVWVKLDKIPAIVDVEESSFDIADSDIFSETVKKRRRCCFSVAKL